MEDGKHVAAAAAAAAAARGTEALGMVLQVYIIGDVGIEEELDLLGISHLGGPEENDKKVELKPGYALPHDSDVSPLLS